MTVSTVTLPGLAPVAIPVREILPWLLFGVVILLANSVHPSQRPALTPLRSQVATIAAASEIGRAHV